MTDYFCYAPSLVLHPPSCARCAKDGGEPARSLCTGCRSARYCSVACQSADWEAHKPVCESIRRTAARYFDVPCDPTRIGTFSDERTEQITAALSKRSLTYANKPVCVIWTYGSQHSYDVLWNDNFVGETLVPGLCMHCVVALSDGLWAHLHTAAEFAGFHRVHASVRARVAALAALNVQKIIVVLCEPNDTFVVSAGQIGACTCPKCKPAARA